MFGVQAFSVTNNIWCVRRRSYLTCSYVVRTSRGLVLIDAGMKSSGKDVCYALEKMGEVISDVKAILLTHWHNDHAAGAASIQKQSRAPVYCHPNEEAALTQVNRKQSFRHWIADLIPEWGPLVLFKGLLGESVPIGVESPILIQDGDPILDDFLVIDSFGHTPGHLCFYYQPEKALFAGDALAVIGDKIRFMARPVTPDLDAARRSMERCLEFEIDVLCPGHRKPLTVHARDESQRMLAKVRSDDKWPLFG